MSLINLEAIQGLKQLQEKTGKPILKQLVDLYIGSTPDVLKKMHVDLDTEKYEDLARAAHSLKSSSGNLGAAEMSELSYLIEEAIIDKQEYTKEQLSNWIQSLETSYEGTSKELMKLAS